jgi:hypothetical protein
MVKLTYVLVLGSALAATAFSLEKRPVNQRISGQSASKIQASFSKGLPVQHSFPTYLKSAEGAEIVAAETKKTSFIDSVWNDSTKLFAYLSVWYLGNIYYNIWNKKACIALGKNASGGANAHWALAAVQVYIYIEYIKTKRCSKYQ